MKKFLKIVKGFFITVFVIIILFTVAALWTAKSDKAATKILDAGEAQRVVQKIEDDKQALIDTEKYQTQQKFIKTSTITISKLYLGKMNSAQGSDIYITFKSNSIKPIKYVYFSLVGFNKAGDIITDEIKGDKLGGRSVGIFQKGQVENGHWGKFYNAELSGIQIDSITIEYTNGSKLNLDRNQVGTIISLQK